MKSALLALGFVLVITLPARADDTAERAVIAKALKAHHGDVDSAKVAAATIQIHGKIHAMGMAIPYTGTAFTGGPDRQKVDLEVDVAGMKIRIVNLINGNKGWAKIDKETKELDKDQIEDAKHQAYVNWIATVAPIKGKGFTLSSIGEVMIEKKPAVGIKVSSKGQRDVDMYFDKTSGLLVKTEARARDEAGKEVTEEIFYSEFKDVQGTRQPMKFIVHRDGKLYLEADVTEYTLSDKLDDSVFARP